MKEDEKLHFNDNLEAFEKIDYMSGHLKRCSQFIDELSREVGKIAYAVLTMEKPEPTSAKQQLGKPLKRRKRTKNGKTQKR